MKRLRETGCVAFFLSRSLPLVLSLSFVSLGAAQCYAQDQDVAEAARQERAHKRNQEKKSKHVYTAEDLKREHILTPEDRAQVEARANQRAPVVAQKPQDIGVSGSPAAQGAGGASLPADAPLGDVARHLRKQKESQKLQRSAEFHLPFSDAPVLASPRPPAQPLRPPVTVITPAPRVATPAPFQPPIRRSPFERPRTWSPAAAFSGGLAPTPRSLGTPPLALRVPAVPATPRAIAPTLPVRPAPLSEPAARALPSPAPRVAPASPPISGELTIVTVKPGDSLWKFAALRLGDGRRWQELLSLNPGLRDPNLIPEGSQIVLPASSAPIQAVTNYTVRHGDTLWTIAQTHFGRAAAWSCVAKANPQIADANFILEGQILTLPSCCTR